MWVQLDCVCNTLISGFVPCIFVLFCFSIFLQFIGADPTLKDNSGYQAIEYAESVKIKEFLNEKMDAVTEIIIRALSLMWNFPSNTSCTKGG